MVAMPLAHISWAIADNAERKACDAFFLDVFGAETVCEILMTPQAERYGFDREERLMLLGDTLLIPIAPAGPGASGDSAIGNMLRRTAAPGRWIGMALRVEDLKAADAWFHARSFVLHYDRGMEDRYFLISRGQAMGVRLEIMQGELPNDPRLDEDWTAKWRDEHPLGLEGLQSIGVSVFAFDQARTAFAEMLDWPEIGLRALPEDDADCVSFLLGDTVIEAMQPRSDDSPLAAHLRDTTGIYCLTFKVRNAEAAAAYLGERGLTLIGDVAGRFAIAPEEAHGRLIYFTGNEVAGYPPLGSKLREPARFPAPG